MHHIFDAYSHRCYWDISWNLVRHIWLIHQLARIMVGEILLCLASMYGPVKAKPRFYILCDTAKFYYICSCVMLTSAKPISLRRIFSDQLNSFSTPLLTPLRQEESYEKWVFIISNLCWESLVRPKPSHEITTSIHLQSHVIMSCLIQKNSNHLYVHMLIK